MYACAEDALGIDIDTKEIDVQQFVRTGEVNVAGTAARHAELLAGLDLLETRNYRNYHKHVEGRAKWNNKKECMQRRDNENDED